MKKEILIIFLFVLSVNLIMAVPDCRLDIPKTYVGTVSYGSDLLEGSYEITAKIGNNYFAGAGQVNEGVYEIDISPCAGVTGTVYFYVNDVLAEQEGSYNGEEDWGKVETLDLTLNEMPLNENSVCGDETKNPSEVCDTEDFGTLTCSNYGFDSGSLSCSDSCDYIYTSNCYNANTNQDTGGNNGGGGGSSTTSGTIVQSENEDGTINLDFEPDKNESEESREIEPTSSGITGAVTGFVKSPGGIATSTLILLVSGIAFFIFKKGKTKKDSKGLEDIKEDF